MIKYLCPQNLNHLKCAIRRRKLGNGGFSHVELYECAEKHEKDKVCKERFVVKNLHANQIKDSRQDEFIDAMRTNEYYIGRKLSHPNVITTIDVDVENNAIIFENFIGIDLCDYLNIVDDPFPPKLVKLFKQVLDGVEYIHSQGVAHMDIKLENILLDKLNDVVKLIDFGQARVFLHPYNKTIIKHEYPSGTQCYFAPELFIDKMFLADKVDSWCCGIVLYNLIYDKMPWEQACEKDKVFNKCMAYIDNNKLHPQYFPNIQNYDFSEKDAEVLEKLLIGLLQPNPIKRMNIHTANTLMNELSIVK
jgi:serine/threonine protein kinase